MKPYGIRGQDWGCCPGHDKYICHKMVNRMQSERIRRVNRPAKKHARQEGKNIVEKGMLDNG